MTDYIAMRPGRARADRRDRQGHRRGLRRGRLRPGRRRDRRAPRAARARRVRRRRRRPPAWSRPPTCSAPAGSAPATSVVAMASSGLHSNGYSLVRHVLLEHGRLGARPRRRRARPHPRRGAARADPDLRQGLPRRSPRATGDPRDGARHRRRPGRQPGAGAARGAHGHHRPRHLDPAPVFDLVAGSGGVPQDDLEATLNCGVGMVALLPPDDVDRAAVALLDRLGVRRLGRRRGRRVDGAARRRGPADRPAPRLVAPDGPRGPDSVVRTRSKHRPFRDAGVREQPPTGSVAPTTT